MFRWLVLVMAAIVPLAVAEESATGVRGVVRDPAGATVSHALVMLRGDAAIEKQAVTGGDGSFQFPNLKPGTYSLIVLGPAGTGARYDNLVLEDGRTISQSVRLQPQFAALPIEIPICTSFPNGPSILYDPSGWKIRMNPGDAPLPAADSTAPKKDK
jgi:hypothetical protein